MSLRSALRRLPACEPPAVIWRRIEASLAGPGVPSAPGGHAAGARSAHYAVAAGLAAILVLAAVVLSGHSGSSDVPEHVEQAVDSGGDLAELLAESARLERALVSLPRHDGVIRVGTASTIAGLEDHIAWLDAELSMSAAFDMDPSYREVLWRERVDVMNALVDVQYAQLPARVLLQ
jgi:hypothetical protein